MLNIANSKAIISMILNQGVCFVDFFLSSASILAGSNVTLFGLLMMYITTKESSLRNNPKIAIIMKFNQY